MSRVRVAVIGGGRGCEHDVSTASAAAVRAGLTGPSYDVVGLGVGRDGVWRDVAGTPLGGAPGPSLAAAVGVLAGCDVAFPAVHGPAGEDGTLAALLGLAGVPYVGAGVRGGALAMDKWVTKLVAGALGIRTAPGLLVTAGTSPPMRWDGPVVVKPVSAGSSVGVGLVGAPSAMPAALRTALAVDDRVLVEQLVRGREVDVAVLRRVDGSLLVGPPLEVVVPSGGLFDSTTKYDGTADLRVPADVGDAARRELEQASLRLFEALGCEGVARCDFFLTEHGAVLNEVNTMPGLTPASQVPRMFAAVGLPYPALLDELVRGALFRHR